MENIIHETSGENESSRTKEFVAVMWVFSLVLVGFFAFFIGRGTKPPEKQVDQVLGALQKAEVSPTLPPAPTQAMLQPVEQQSVTPTPDVSPCTKSGMAQKWEFLASYTVNEGDSLQSIASSELGDAGRTNEILQINGTGPYVAGSTIYLPPKSITKSNGRLQLVQGKLVERDASNWHVSFNDEKDGRGILIPTFWFADIPDRDSYHVGDCVSVLLDDGFKVFSVNLQ